MFEIVFWQGIVSPHMACLANEVAKFGHNVRYVAAKPMSSVRMAQGWIPPVMDEVRLDYIAHLDEINTLLQDISPKAVHVVQGIRGHGYLANVVNRLGHGQTRWGVVLETVKEPAGIRAIKRLIYTLKLSRFFNNPDFVLGIGEKTPSWVAARGYPKHRIFPFTYFLASGCEVRKSCDRKKSIFRVGFVGQLNRGKRVDLLIDSLESESFSGVELVVVGGGPLEAELKTLAQEKLSHVKLKWLGQLPMEKARREIATLDCLVLPSRHDGWGAVISEALLVGVPAICSNACGAALAVRASGVGGVFPSGDAALLRQLLAKAVVAGSPNPTDRQHLARWASCFGVTAGAVYLIEILDAVYKKGARPVPPWTGPERPSVGVTLF